MREVQVDPEQIRLLGGFIGHIEIVPEMTQRIAYVPAESVVAESKQNSAVSRFVKIKISLKSLHGRLETGKIAIHEGLEDGALIV